MNRVTSYTAAPAHLPRHSRSTQAKEPQGHLEFPEDGVELARNNRPVVLLHGTLVEKEGIEAFRDFALRSGHPVNHRTYASITKGAKIEESSEIASQEVNLSRLEVASRNLSSLQGKGRAELQKAFQLDPNLYGTHDPSVDYTLDRLPGLLGELDTLLAQPKEQSATLLSGQLSRLEQKFSLDLEKDGIPASKARGLAREVLDTVAPKAVVIGHSAGGFVAHNLVVNPETEPDQDKFTYDAGNGIAEALIISSPIEKGLNKPAPPGVAELPYYNFEKSVIRPLEKLPTSRLMLANPLVNAVYKANKSFLKSLAAANFMLSATMSSPLTYLLRPGNEQVEEGSEFFENRIKDKAIPEGVSVVSFTSPLDRLVLEERAALQTEEPNGHSFSVDLQVSQEDLERERPTWTHVIMTEKPDLFKEQFAGAVTSDSKRFQRLMDPANDEGTRHEALSMLQSALSENPSLLAQQCGMRETLQKVAEERLPFTDSASYLAHQLLQSSRSAK